ncbi:hypothetical protein M3Y97_00492000 [Aphelenchoides bicaudatus]|nr:hypothetical protein M3Y97_00492000 [Aphelenchoides bicaudatus]
MFIFVDQLKMNARTLLSSLDLLRRHNAPPTMYLISVRQRSSYYKENTNSFVPRFVRSYLYRHPKAPFAIILGMCVIVISEPYWKVYYARFMMHEKDYQGYRLEANRTFLDRGRHGANFYIPFVQPDRNDEIYERYMQRTRDRKAGLYKDEN